jgi:adenylate cyclase
MHFWLKLRPFYLRHEPLFFAIALLLPVSALFGFTQAGREIDFLIARDPGWVEEIKKTTHALGPGEGLDLVGVHDAIVYGFWASLGFVFVARTIRQIHQRRTSIRITYPEGREVQVPRGFSVLEASRFAGLPHASVCGGRGRCSTCRIRVSKGFGELPPSSAGERRVLQRVGAAPNVRLACQLRPKEDLSVTPLLPAGAQPSDGFTQPAYLAGQELTIAVMFADLRSFTGISEKKLPYDLVFLLNSYFEAVGAAITTAGGVVDKFVGDGVMALFGVDGGPQTGCRQALSAAQAMVEQVALLSRNMAEDIVEPLRIGIGIHCGPAVVGRMGYGTATHVTAIGDTVNVASRLQDVTKEYNCQLVISEEVAKQAGLNVVDLPRHEVMVRNRREALAIFAVNDLSAIDQR